MSAPSAGWQHVIIVVASLGFTAFALWLFAATFDSTEFKSLLMIAAGIVGREFVPSLRKYVEQMTDTLGRSG